MIVIKNSNQPQKSFYFKNYATLLFSDLITKFSLYFYSTEGAIS